jgi:hypothetical protein
MILEGIVTTLNDDGSVNISPMGPRVDRTLDWLELRPFRTSATYRNLKRSGVGVFHVIDDALLLARAAIHDFPEPVPVVPCRAVSGMVLEDACHWLALEVQQLQDDQERTTIHCRTVHRQHVRPFLGWNRAQHAVIEAAILATRVHLLDAEAIRQQLAALEPLVQKTAGPGEQQAFALLSSYIEGAIR